VGAVVRALQRGERETLSDPESAVEAMVERVPALNRDELARQLDAVQPAYQAPDGSIGTLELPLLRRWAAWEQRFGIVRRRPEVALMFDPSFARVGARAAAQSDG
jgi:ABC-type nitrate/sulfonate/bicarbonate transport system substrate-binding protein